MEKQKYIGANLVSNLKAKYTTLDNKINANTALIGDIDTLLTTLDTGTGV